MTFLGHLLIVACGVLVALTREQNRRLAVRLRLAEHVVDDDQDARRRYADLLEREGLRR